jgi:hypothetical protein
MPSGELAHLLVRAGVYERDPSANRWFIEPAVRKLGAEQVLARLLDYLRIGTDVEKAGAASARYWVRGDEAFGSSAIVAAFREATLREFVGNPDVDLRRRIVPGLSLRAADYPPDMAPLIAEAIALARAHPDDYIRHRIEVQLDAGGPLQAMPTVRHS